MQTTIRNILTCTLFLIVSSISNTKAQNWVVGVPVNAVVVPNLIDENASVLGCFPNPSKNISFTTPIVSGISYYLKVTSVDANKCFFSGPTGNDTLAIGDSIPVNSGMNTKSISYYGTTLINPVQLDLRAVGTPTTSGQPHCCNITTTVGISNLLFCPEGITLFLPTNCTVTGGTVSILDLKDKTYQFIQPAANNNFTASIINPDINSMIMLISSTGKIIRSVKAKNGINLMPCNDVSNGIYMITSMSNGKQHTEKLSIFN
jgi:hypothetical protein